MTGLNQLWFSAQAAALIDTLAAHTPASAAAPRRRAAIGQGGLPYILSIKASEGDSSVYRKVIFEPGSLAQDATEQIDTALGLARELCAEIGNAESAHLVRAVADLSLPSAPAERAALWGGVWLGVEDSVAAPALRVYLSLRHGELEQRWTRIAAIASCLGLADGGHAIAHWRSQLGPARPAGLCLAVNAKGLDSVRFYLTLPTPTLDDIAAWLGQDDTLDSSLILAAAHGFQAQFGNFDRQSVSLCHDFPMHDGRLTLQAQRRKLELSCQALTRTQRASVPAWLADWTLDRGLRFASALEAGTVEAKNMLIQYLSLGVTEHCMQLALYFEPQHDVPASSMRSHRGQQDRHCQ